MQSHAKDDNFDLKLAGNPLLRRAIKDAIGITSPFASKIFNPATGAGDEIGITEKQIEILEDAIKRYERLEDIKKFSKIALEDMENVTEEDIRRAVELEEMVSIEDEKAVLNLIQNEGFLWDLESKDFSDILNGSGEFRYTENISPYRNTACDADFQELYGDEPEDMKEDDFSDFDFE